MMKPMMPPGVLTGLPLVMFEAAPELDMYAVPEQWLENDLSVIEEMMEAIETERVKTIDEEMDEIQFQLTRFERYQDQTAYYVYPMTWKNGGITALYEFTAFGIKDALEQFEEDFEEPQLKGFLPTQIHVHETLDTSSNPILTLPAGLVENCKEQAIKIAEREKGAARSLVLPGCNRFMMPDVPSKSMRLRNF